MALNTLPDGKFETLMGILTKISGEINRRLMGEAIAKALGVDRPQARELLDTVRWISDRTHHVDPEFVENVVTALVAGESKLPAESRAGAIARFRRAQSSRVMEIFEAASTLMVRNNKNFRYSRAVTEMRPVFVDGVENRPAAYVIEHQLQIDFSRNTASRVSNIESIFLALDSDDLEILIETLSRCKTKSRSLEGQLDSLSVPYVKTLAY